jgi:hypothetical protein
VDVNRLSLSIFTDAGHGDAMSHLLRTVPATPTGKP